MRPAIRATTIPEVVRIPQGMERRHPIPSTKTFPHNRGMELLCVLSESYREGYIFEVTTKMSANLTPTKKDSGSAYFEVKPAGIEGEFYVTLRITREGFQLLAANLSAFTPSEIHTIDRLCYGKVRMEDYKS